MLRIEAVRIGEAEVLMLEGKVAGPWVHELRTFCADALEREHGPLVLDLAGVTFIDREGIVLLRDMGARGASLTNGSPFVLDQLNELP